MAFWDEHFVCVRCVVIYKRSSVLIFICQTAKIQDHELEDELNFSNLEGHLLSVRLTLHSTKLSIKFKVFWTRIFVDETLIFQGQLNVFFLGLVHGLPVLK
jgi:hypothetical protein